MSAEPTAESNAEPILDGTAWTKASASGVQGNCVELRRSGGLVEVRDSKQRGTGPILRFTGAAAVAWLDGARRGEFDRLG